jgi:hypothetical protein
LAIGLPGCFAIFKVLLFIKNLSKTYENFFQPFIISIMWFCVLFPFGVCVPVISIYLNHTDSTFASFVQITIVGGLLVCIMGVTGITILLQILINVLHGFVASRKKPLRRNCGSSVPNLSRPSTRTPSWQQSILLGSSSNAIGKSTRTMRR